MKLIHCLAGALASGVFVCGCATTSSNATSVQPVSAAVLYPNCLTETGSRITEDMTSCRGFGRSYTAEDISRTGKTSAAEALSLLDPSIAVHR